MIHANIYNTKGQPLTDEGFLIYSDADFTQAETAAQDAAESGQRCYIKWSRDSDGQVAYWGPSGACFEPYWYARPGRPSEMNEGKRVNIYLDKSSLDKATALGNGNVSEGIRKALKQFNK